MKFLKWVGRVILLVMLGVLAVFVVARFSDGPIGPFLGGALTSGELVATPISAWSFEADEGEITLQLAQESTSRTVWLAVVNGSAYIPAATGFPPNKSWHVRAEDNGSALIRVAGKRYPVLLTRLAANSEEFDAALARFAEQQATPPGGRDKTWIFRVDGR